jgi:hypothetical protein
MNVDRIEREMAYARANITTNEQKSILNAYAETAKLRSLLTGLFIGFAAAAIGLLVGRLLWINLV